MAVTQLDNRGKFLVFESNAVRLNNDIFPAESINVSLSPSIDPLMDIDGRVTNYAPNGSLKGRVDLSFDLTGELPTYFHATGVTEAPTLVKFNTFVIYGYLENLTYEVSPYRPIKVNAGFAFFHGIKYLETQFKDKIPASFDSSLKTYNGLRSYLVGDTRNYSFISSFNYSLTTRRTPYTKVGFESPTRVALEDVRIEINAQGSNINNYMTIRGNETYLRGNLNELYNSNNTIVMPLAGRVVEQSFSASQGSVGQGSFKAIQSLNRIRKNVSIPFIENQLILTATPDRVFELPDFDSTCPPGVIDEQPVDGGDPGRGWTPPGGDYDPCWREGNCEPGDGGGDNGALPPGPGGEDGAGGGVPEEEVAEDPPINETDYEWVVIFSYNGISQKLTDGQSSDTSIVDYFGGFHKPSIFKDEAGTDVAVSDSNGAPPVVIEVTTLIAGFGQTVQQGLVGVRKGGVGGLHNNGTIPALMSDCYLPIVGLPTPCDEVSEEVINANVTKNYVLAHYGKYVKKVTTGAQPAENINIASAALTFEILDSANKAESRAAALADTSTYGITLTWQDNKTCEYDSLCSS